MTKTGVIVGRTNLRKKDISHLYIIVSKYNTIKDVVKSEDILKGEEGNKMHRQQKAH
jgi:hypothetical protein